MMMTTRLAATAEIIPREKFLEGEWRQAKVVHRQPRFLVAKKSPEGSLREIWREGKESREKEMVRKKMIVERQRPSCLPISSYPMNGGDSPYCYAQNSSMQRSGLESAMAVINEAIANNLDIKRFFSLASNSFSIADLGCSVGPNTFFAVQRIIESVKQKYQSDRSDSEIPDFQVYFNDHISNDFNTLFKSIPLDRPYHASGVPGSFHSRLFPKASLHFVHSSYAMQWLSKMPREVVEKSSPAWNKGRAFYPYAPKEVLEAYRNQFAKDKEVFLDARAVELVPGGLMAFLLPYGCKCMLAEAVDILGIALMDVADMGLVSEDQVDSFNMPMYFPTQQDIEAIVERNGQFSIERMELLDQSHVTSPIPISQTLHLQLRAGWEGLVREHFGDEIVEIAFDRFKQRLAESSMFSDPSYPLMVELLVILKRK